jgi:hypothetical protein
VVLAKLGRIAPRERGRMLKPSLRANGSRECAPDDRLREAIHDITARPQYGLLRRIAPRNDDRRLNWLFEI